MADSILKIIQFMFAIMFVSMAFLINELFILKATNIVLLIGLAAEMIISTHYQNKYAKCVEDVA